jgi:hypothetical protein
VHLSFGPMSAGVDIARSTGDKEECKESGLSLYAVFSNQPNLFMYSTNCGKATSGSAISGCQRFSHSSDRYAW